MLPLFIHAMSSLRFHLQGCNELISVGARRIHSSLQLLLLVPYLLKWMYLLLGGKAVTERLNWMKLSCLGRSGQAVNVTSWLSRGCRLQPKLKFLERCKSSVHPGDWEGGRLGCSLSLLLQPWSRATESSPYKPSNPPCLCNISSTRIVLLTVLPAKREKCETPSDF